MPFEQNHLNKKNYGYINLKKSVLGEKFNVGTNTRPNTVPSPDTIFSTSGTSQRMLPVAFCARGSFSNLVTAS